MQVRIKAFSKVMEFFEKRAWLCWTLTLIYAGIIFYFSSFPMPPTPLVFDIPDTIKHIVEYTGLGGLLFVSFLSIGKKKKSALFFAIIFASLYGISDEIHQFFVPGRVCSLIDMSSDAIGGFIGSFFGISQK